jgi:subtilisin family serine protease
MPMLAQAIERVSSNVDVITASYTYWCGFWCSWFGEDDDLLKAIDHAVQRGVAVILAAGNDSRELPNTPLWEYVVGCQRNGKALCVGAVGTDGLMTGFSNSGASVVTYAPGFDVRVSHLPSNAVPPDPNEEEKYCSFDGTSASTPFVAGIIALAESAWGQRLGNPELRGVLAQASRVPKGGDVPILDAAAFLRQKLVFREVDEPNNTLTDVEGSEPKLPDPAAIYTLDSDYDTDLFPLKLTPCTSLVVDMNYIADWEDGSGPSALSLTLLDATGNPFARGERLGAGTFKLSATLKANQKYYLRVSNQAAADIPKALPTAYDLNTTLTNCTP